MTNPAGVDVNGHLSGVDPNTGGVLAYQAVPILARTIYSNYDGRQPFYTNYGKGPVANSAATYDAVTGTALNTATRHVDPYGNVAELHKVWKLLHYWLMDGAPTNMGPIGAATNRIPLYIRLANQLRPWPQGFTGAATGEPTKAYPAFPPSAATPLDTFLAQSSTRDAAKAHSAYHGVEPVVHNETPKTEAPQNYSASPQQPVGNWVAAQAHRPIPQFTPDAGPEHYAAAGYSPNQFGEAKIHPSHDQPMYGVEAPLNQWVELNDPGPQPVTSNPGSPLDVILRKLNSIEQRLDRAGL